MVDDRDRIWTTLDGRKIPIRCLSDIHLANCIFEGRKRALSQINLGILLSEAELRDLSSDFLAMAPIPWQDVDGKWKRLSPKKNEYEVIGR